MISQKKIDSIKVMLDKNFTPGDIAKKYNIQTRTARRYIRLTKEQMRTENIRIPKILLLDIETVMMEAYIWFQGKQRISDNQIIKDWNIVAWAAKWLFDTENIWGIQTPTEAIERNDFRLIKEVWKVMDDADIIIGHNLNRFDIRKLNSRFLEYGFMPPSPYKTIDTLKVAKKNFSLSSYKLNFLAKFLGVQGKLHTDYDLWKQCLQGDPKALKLMSKYNIQDVLVLEDVYVKLRPWIKSHPSLSLYMDVDVPVCENCGSIDIEFKGKYYTTNVNRYKAFRCNECGAIGRNRYAEKRNRDMLVSVAK